MVACGGLKWEDTSYFRTYVNKNGALAGNTVDVSTKDIDYNGYDVWGYVIPMQILWSGKRLW